MVCFHENIQLVNNKYVKLSPVLGKIHAGVLFKLLKKHIQQIMKLYFKMTKDVIEYFYLKLKGNSMEQKYKDESTLVFLKTSDLLLVKIIMMKDYSQKQ